MRNSAFGEGPLTKARAKLVNRRTLAEHGRQLGLGKSLVLSRGENCTVAVSAFGAGGCVRSVARRNFSGCGIEAARTFILGIHSGVRTLSAIPILENPKGELQELLQSVSAEAPLIMCLATGPDHDRVFECTVHHAGWNWRGARQEQESGESEAALVALTKLRAEISRNPKTRKRWK